MLESSLQQCLIHFPLIEKPLLRFEWPRADDPDLLPVGAINTEHPHPSGGHSQIEETRLNRKTRRIRQYPQRKRILERFFYLPLGQRAIEIEGRIIPIKLHIELFVNRSPMQCLYKVFTHRLYLVNSVFVKNWPPVARWPDRIGLIGGRLFFPTRLAAAAQIVHQINQGKEHRDDDATHDDSQEDDHDRLQ
jgi:hypothetical protein